MSAEKVIRKHVAIIHAYSQMSSLQRKLFNVLLYEANKSFIPLNTQDSVSVECRIPLAILSKSVNFNSNNRQYLREAIDELASLKIEWNLLKDRVPTNISFLNLRILHGAPTFYQDGTVNFSFHKVLLDLTNNPPIYGTIDIDLQSQFESKYGQSLYENGTRFVNLNKNKIIELDVFRKLLGVREGKYHSMRELTRNVLSPAVEEVNDRTNFTVGLEPRKTGRKIVGFELSVNSKKSKALVPKQEGIQEHELLKEEIKRIFGTVNDTIIEDILRNYTAEYIYEKIAYTKKHAKKDSFFYPVPYFISALKGDYKSSTGSQEPKSGTTETDSPNVVLEWNSEFNRLQHDLLHWKGKLEFYIRSDDHVQAEHIKGIIVSCEEKLQQHYMNRPT